VDVADGSVCRRLPRRDSPPESARGGLAGHLGSARTAAVAPLWLAMDLCVPLRLETSYLEACRSCGSRPEWGIASQASGTRCLNRERLPPGKTSRYNHDETLCSPSSLRPVWQRQRNPTPRRPISRIKRARRPRPSLRPDRSLRRARDPGLAGLGAQRTASARSRPCANRRWNCSATTSTRLREKCRPRHWPNCGRSHLGRV